MTNKKKKVMAAALKNRETLKSDAYGAKADRVSNQAFQRAESGSVWDRKPRYNQIHEMAPKAEYKSDTLEIKAGNEKLTNARDLLAVAAIESVRPSVAGEGSDTLPPDEQKKKDEANKRARALLAKRK